MTRDQAWRFSKAPGPSLSDAFRLEHDLPRAVCEFVADSILIVEDEVLVALEMESILQERGYEVIGIAVDLEGALAFADRHVDLALVDLNLRDGLTGPEIGRRLANEHRAKVLFVTANPRLLGDGIAGTIGVLTKPTDESSLTSAVAYALSRATEAPPSLRCFNSSGAAERRSG